MNGVCLRAIENERVRRPTFFALNLTLPIVTLFLERRQTDSLMRTVTAWAAAEPSDLGSPAGASPKAPATTAIVPAAKAISLMASVKRRFTTSQGSRARRGVGVCELRHVR
jgi:hypothetical protein